MLGARMISDTRLLFELAAECRRLAKDSDSDTARRLRGMATEYEALAIANEHDLLGTRPLPN
jgi:hypothetical protein